MMAERVRRRLVIGVIRVLCFLAALVAAYHSTKQYISAGRADRIKPSARSNGAGIRHTTSLDPIQDIKTSDETHGKARRGIGLGGSIAGGIGIGVVAFAACVGSAGVPAAKAMEQSMTEAPAATYGKALVQQASGAASSAAKALQGLTAVNESRAREDARTPKNRLPWERDTNNNPLAALIGQNRLPWQKDNNTNPLSRIATTLTTPPRGLPWESYENPLAALLDIKKENPFTSLSESLSEGRLPWQDQNRMPWDEDENPLDALFEENRLPWEKSPLEDLLDEAKETVVPFAAVGGGIAALHVKKTAKRDKDAADPPSS